MGIEAMNKYSKSQIRQAVEEELKLTVIPFTWEERLVRILDAAFARLESEHLPDVGKMIEEVNERLKK